MSIEIAAHSREAGRIAGINMSLRNVSANSNLTTQYAFFPQQKGTGHLRQIFESCKTVHEPDLIVDALIIAVSTPEALLSKPGEEKPT
jgi:hypothetical protein